MGTEEGGLHGHRGAFFQAPDDAQELHLPFRVQTIAGLDFGRAGALGLHFLQTLQALAVDLVLGGLSDQVRRIENAAAPGRDLLIAQAVDLVEKLARPAAGIDDMRMAVAERRHHHAPFRVYDLVIFRYSTVTKGVYSSFPDAEPGIFQRAGFVHGGAFLAENAVGNDADQEPYVLDNH